MNMALKNSATVSTNGVYNEFLFLVGNGFPFLLFSHSGGCCKRKTAGVHDLSQYVSVVYHTNSLDLCTVNVRLRKEAKFK